jgi:Xaa-Pro aminopeptidase
MARARPGWHEYEVEAELAHEFLRQGAQAVAYPSIVASGPNACVLHYRDNDRRMADGDLILIDAGCEFRGYASDITRTFPVNGRFTGPQKDVYEVVLAAQLACIEAVRPGVPFHDYHRVAERVLAQGLVDLKLIDGPLDAALESGSYKRFYMHRAGHWLGMDVHDVGDYKVGDEWRVFEPGMVLTIEPGIYIAPDEERVPAQYRGIGVRIEDDVVITADGCESLTSFERDLIIVEA